VRWRRADIRIRHASISAGRRTFTHFRPLYLRTRAFLFAKNSWLQICIKNGSHFIFFPSKTGQNKTRLLADPARPHQRWPPHLHQFTSSPCTYEQEPFLSANKSWIQICIKLFTFLIFSKNNQN